MSPTTTAATTTHRRTSFGLWTGSSRRFAGLVAAGYPLVGIWGLALAVARRR